VRFVRGSQAFGPVLQRGSGGLMVGCSRWLLERMPRENAPPEQGGPASRGVLALSVVETGLLGLKVWLLGR